MYKDAVIEGMEPFPADAKEKLVPIEDLYFDAPPARMVLQPVITTKALILDGTLNNTIHIGAAEPDKTALVMNIDGERRSAFTWALDKVAQPNMTIAEFEIAVTNKQKEITDHHHPQIAASPEEKSRKLFQ
jgi:hypothetical protein